MFSDEININGQLNEHLDLATCYRSVKHELPENLDGVPVIDKTPGRIEAKYDLGLRNSLNNVMKKGGIPFEGTYFIIDIGDAHLPGVAEDLMKKGIDIYFMIPGKACNRIKETMQYWKKDFEGAGKNLGKPNGYATLIDCHREGIPSDSYDGGYCLIPSAFPTAQQLKELGIKRVVYMNEGRGKLERSFGADAVEDVSSVIEKYEKGGITFIQQGIWSFPFNAERNYTTTNLFYT